MRRPTRTVRLVDLTDTSLSTAIDSWQGCPGGRRVARFALLVAACPRVTLSRRTNDPSVAFSFTKLNIVAKFVLDRTIDVGGRIVRRGGRLIGTWRGLYDASAARATTAGPRTRARDCLAGAHLAARRVGRSRGEIYPRTHLRRRCSKQSARAARRGAIALDGALDSDCARQ